MNDRASRMTPPKISDPANRKPCQICYKFLYFHQFILRCNKCKNVFHGSCLKLDNDSIFVLQQHVWYCKPCSNDIDMRFNCMTCLMEIDVFNERITQCKQCFKMLHKKCKVSNICVSCMPLPLLDRGKNLSRWVRNRDFLCFPRQTATFGILRDKSRFFQIFAMNRDFCAFPRQIAII